MKANIKNTNNLSREEQIKILEVFFATENAEAISQAQDNFINYLAENEITKAVKSSQIENWITEFLKAINKSTNSIPEIIDDDDAHRLVRENICIPVMDKIGIQIEHDEVEFVTNKKKEWLIIKFVKKFMILMRNFFKKMKGVFIKIRDKIKHDLIDIGGLVATAIAGGGLSFAASSVVNHFGWQLVTASGISISWQAGIIYLASIILAASVGKAISFVQSLLRNKVRESEINKETAKSFEEKTVRA